MRAIAALFAISLATAFGALAQAPPPPAALDYAAEGNWLCRPGRADLCAQDQTAAAVAANGAVRVERFRAKPAAKIDCFYVYPTVSLDAGGNSDTNVGAEERGVIAQQFARFGAVCRTFAPLYRQVTVTALRAGIAGAPIPLDRELAYRDAKAAWAHYMANDNAGRGVVLIGHSQGAGVLNRLIREEIEGKPVQAQIVSAMLIGTNIGVPEGKDVGGDFKSMPLCRAKAQTGCVVAFVSFDAKKPPPANTRFGVFRDRPGMQAACVNPAAPKGGAAPLKSYFGARAQLVGEAAPIAWAKGKTIDAPFVTTPGLITAECVASPAGSYLAVTVNADPQDPRTDEIGGEVVAAGRVQADWGLHLIDMHLAMGDLVAMADAQGKAWRAGKR